MNVQTIGSWFVAAGFVALLAGCREDRALAASRGEGARNAAVERMVSEYCDRQASCDGEDDGDVPAGCMSGMRRSVMAQFDAQECLEGVSETELARCVQAVRSGECDNPLDTLSQLNACSAQRVCTGRR